MTRRIHKAAASLTIAMLVLPLLPAADAATPAAPPGPGTVRALLTSNGTVRNVKVLTRQGRDGTHAEPFRGRLPVTLSISRTATGGEVGFGYRIANTTGTTREVTYTDTGGTEHSTQADLQLPLVATLSVTVPKSLGTPRAPGAAVTTDSDGTHHLLWSLVLFSPLGSPSQQVGFTVAGKGGGSPSATLQAAAVRPTAAPGLAASGQAANANIQTFDTLKSYAIGGDAGLRRLVSGTGQLVSGLGRLYDGSTALRGGLATAGTGAGRLADGAGKAHTGSGRLTAGLRALGKGQRAETKGLGEIYAGLTQLSDPEAGLPNAVGGVGRLKAGVDQIITGIGTDGRSGTVLGGLAAVVEGIERLRTAVRTQIGPGVSCAAEVIATIAEGNATARTNTDGCWKGDVVPVFPPQTDPVTKGYLTSYAATLRALSSGLSGPGGVSAGLGTIDAGLKQLKAGISHPATSAKDPGGIKEGLQAISVGLGRLRSGLGTAATGVGALRTGTGAAFAGSKQLTGGAEQAAAGSGDLTKGLGLLSTGSRQLATGLPAAATGAGKIAAGLGDAMTGGRQVNDGVGQLRSGAVKPLSTQLQAGANNARQQVAILEAAGALTETTPRGGDTYVLTQHRPGADHLLRNIALACAAVSLVGLGGLLGNRRRGRNRRRHAQP
ncbi:hypothetical protein ACRYCC_08160 [Actinomadura scrupuli]|uniref:hypothetical protein n=1 Tax=Actinomadura scrupuli TaxID=559629 RepID=UPI003D99A9EF